MDPLHSKSTHEELPGEVEQQRKKIDVDLQKQAEKVFKKKEQAPSPSLTKRKVTLWFSIVGSLIVELGRRIKSLFYNAFHTVFHQAVFDPHKLIKAEKEIDPSQQFWLQNLALLRTAEEATDDPATKAQIRF